jgi:methylated-DNA-[protein]-cysteine S-methyltransferase
MWTVVPSPVGDLRVVAVDGCITAIDFRGEMPPRSSRESRSVERFAARAADLPLEQRADADPLLLEAARQLEAYFSGAAQEFDLPLAPAGSEFQQRVWAQLQEICYGQTATYGEVAARLGLSGQAARAVGAANGCNPIPIVIPCHRVVGARGVLTGYGGGIERKRTLLALEGGALF